MSGAVNGAMIDAVIDAANGAASRRKPGATMRPLLVKRIAGRAVPAWFARPGRTPSLPEFDINP